MAWNYAAESTWSAKRLRTKPPTERELAAAVEYRGCYLFERKNVRLAKVDIYFPENPEYDRWGWAFNLHLARHRVDEWIEAGERLAAARARREGGA